MDILVHRFEYGDTYTISRMYIDDVYECYVLEDKVRGPGIKVPNETAIPAGTYKVIIDYSDHFKEDLPHLLDVPMFEGIRIHSGNTDSDTEGCLLLGTGWTGGDMITNSRVAFAHFFPQLQKAVALGDVFIRIEDTK